ncbi:MAG: CRISPR-associated helicase Cas3' [Bifidobacterium sp.]|jgi:CRISPR-associated endonuclease/helicase Cas3
MSTFYARKDKYGAVQTLLDHLHNTARLAGEFEDGFADTSQTAAIHHDEGKAKEDFQKYLFTEGAKRGSVIHAYQGAFTISEIPTSSAPEKLTQEILELVITSHHSDLPDCVLSNGCGSFFDKMLDDNRTQKKYHYQEVKKNLPGLRLDTHARFKRSVKDTGTLIEELTHAGFHTKESLYFSLGLYAKYIFSRLVDADRLDAGNFSSHQRFLPAKPDWQKLVDSFEENIRNFDNTTAINQIRSEISEECRKAATRKTGIYKLAVPTGGGKTLASLRFALHHALRTRKNRIIYVAPYLTITTQTTQSFRNVLDLSSDDDTILEHYSNVLDSDDTSTESDQEDGSTVDRRKLAAERWENPIIITTMVQFLETVMSSHGTKLRKFHNMANSVIVFDEIQSIPVNTVNLFNEAVSFLSKILNCSIVLCSATQPLLEETDRHNLLLSENPNLVCDSNRYAIALKRTSIVPIPYEMSLDELAGFVKVKAHENRNCLVIVNLKSEARKLYQYLEKLTTGDEFALVHLSTSMCGRHRAEKLKKVIGLLNTHQPVICVSTQLIEAGVDISFACVVRAMAGLDSILQSAGRCNRNGESKEPKKVYVAPIKNEHGLERLRDIKKGKEITNRLIHDHPGIDLLSDEMLHEFYELYFAQRHAEMDYPVESLSRSVYSMLSYNSYDRKRFTDRTCKRYGHQLAQAFRTASDHFHVIPNLTTTVIVPYLKDNQDTKVFDLLESFKSGDMKMKIDLLRLLQDYSVSLFDYEIEKLSDVHAISVVDSEFGISLLDKQYYEDEYGVVLETEMSPMII